MDEQTTGLGQDVGGGCEASEPDATQVFYRSTLQSLIDRGVFDRDASTLVLAAGATDVMALRAMGFSNVVCSNVDERAHADAFLPFRFERLNAQDIGCEDNAFDQVIIANALHHCRSPHLALMEMHRVARRCVLAFENRDSLTMRIAKRLGMAQEYEYESVYFSDMSYGGVDNTDVPNFIYRWKEDEVRKTVATFAPEVAPRVHFFYGLRSPDGRLSKMRSKVKLLVVKSAFAGFRLFTKLFPGQSNLFAFCVEKGGEHWPWLVREGDRYAFNREWGQRRFGGA